ncbi:MAG TPA: hypothetical protein VFC85_01350 [Verrucomicrobiae bacterium]|nr:hypothetical protein [Verrucomicrobiae bacterium]
MEIFKASFVLGGAAALENRIDSFSLTPRFNAVNAGGENKKPFKRFFSPCAFNTSLKQGVNNNFSTKQHAITNGLN